MKTHHVTRAGLIAILATIGSMAMSQNQPAAAADPWAATVDPRVQQRSYLFTDTGEQMPYALFVSSKVGREGKSPVIVALHGLGGTHNTMVSTRLKTIDLAEEGGYIFVAPMGYNCGGWYGMPVRARGGGAPGGGGQRGATPQGAPSQGAPPQGAPPRGAGGGRGGGAMACNGGGTKITDAAEVRAMSEKDVMNVLALVRKEFNVDERRIYLMGHSMGGAGTLYLGATHPEVWAAIAADAPPFAGHAEELAKAQLPTLVIQGDLDNVVPVEGTRAYVETLNELGANHKYVEIAGLDHNIGGIADMYEWFAKHSRPAR